MAMLAAERLSADIAHRKQIEIAPPAPPTSGSLQQPMKEGTTVDGGVRERMRREDAGQRPADVEEGPQR
jgi:hypothetical protein